MHDEREAAEPLIVPKILPADHWLKGYKAGYHGQPAQPPRGKKNAAAYLKGYAEGSQARERAGNWQRRSQLAARPRRITVNTWVNKAGRAGTQEPNKT